MAAVALLREPLQDPQTLWNDLDADAVAGDHRDIENALRWCAHHPSSLAGTNGPGMKLERALETGSRRPWKHPLVHERIHGAGRPRSAPRIAKRPC